MVSPSPEQASRSGRYENGWIAINRLIREGETWSGHERNVLYWNHGDGRFSDVSAVAGLDFPEDSRAFATFDFDRDGDLDIVLKNRNSPQLRLLRNDLPLYHHSVAFQLEGSRGNRDAVGARLVLETAGRKWTKSVRSGSGFLSQPTRIVYFGLGAETVIRGLTVFWPGGEAQRYEKLPVDHLIRLKEGKAGFSSDAFKKRSRPAREDAGAAATSPSSQFAQSVWLTEALPVPRLVLHGLDGESRALESDRGRALLVNFWAAWCPPCQAELADFESHRKEIEASGLRPVLVSVDAPEEKSKVREFVRARNITFPIVLANEEIIRVYSQLLRHLLDQASDLVVPTTFLVNPSGDIVKFYMGRASVEQILSDAAQLTGGNNDRSRWIRRALPFPGKAYFTEFRRNWIDLADTLAFAGLSEQASAYLEHAVQAEPDQAALLDRLGLLNAHAGRWDEAVDLFQKAIRQGHPGADAHIHLATALSHFNRLGEAQAAAQRALSAVPEDPEALRVWAAITSRLGNPQLALPALLRSLQLDPESADAFYNLGLLRQKLGHVKDAADAFRRAVEIKPDHADALNTLGVIYAQGHSLEEAIGFFNRALKVKPDSAEARRNLGLVYAQEGKMPQAEESFRAALRLEPQYAEALNDLGVVYLKTGKPREALALFQQARHAKPDLTEAYLNAARVYVALGDNRNAVTTLETLLKLRPDEPAAAEWLRKLKSPLR